MGIFLLFRSLFSWVTSIFLTVFGDIASWAKANPRLAADILVEVVVIVVCLYGGYRWAAHKYDAKIAQLQSVVQQYQALDKQRQDKIAALETSSKQAADQLDQFKTDTAKRVDSIISNYTQALKIAQSQVKVQIVKVKDPNTQAELPITFEDGNLVCNRFSAGFTTTVNNLIDTANTQIGEPPK
jgi:apolipoprotein N-acyltransferase